MIEAKALLILLILSAFALISVFASEAADLKSFLRQEAEIYVEAYLARDYDTCMKMMGGSIIQALGGRVSVLDHFRTTEEKLARYKLMPETITVDEPGALIRRGAKEQYVVIPERHIYVGKEGKYVLNSYILAISEDNAKTWSLLEGNWRISEHIKNRDLVLYDELKLPTRKVYLADDPNIAYVEKGGDFVTSPQTLKYKESLRRRDNPPPPPPRRSAGY